MSSKALSPIERLLLSNQLRILATLYPDEASGPHGFETRREAVDRGYLIDDLWQFLDTDTMSEEECREVWDTLDMFDSLKRAADQHGFAEWLNEQPCGRFRGYDGNHEITFLGFVDYTIYQLERWIYLEIPRGLNSHAPMRPRYHAMLERWQAIPVLTRNTLSEEQVRNIIAD